MSILNPQFKYIHSSKTDLKSTFKRIRKEQAEAAKKLEAEHIERIQKVRRLK